SRLPASSSRHPPNRSSVIAGLSARAWSDRGAQPNREPLQTVVRRWIVPDARALRQNPARVGLRSSTVWFPSRFRRSPEKLVGSRAAPDTTQLREDRHESDPPDQYVPRTAHRTDRLLGRPVERRGRDCPG